MKVRDVAKLLGTTEQTVRVGLRMGVFPFGVAYKTCETNKNYVYVIFPEKVKEYVASQE